VDTWGVDFGLLGADGRLLENPVCHRDGATQGMGDFIASKIKKEDFYQLTGMVPHPVGTLAQLCVCRKRGTADPLRYARDLLLMPDLIRYFLCGHKAIELTSAGNTQLTNIRTATWSQKLFGAMDVPRRIMPDIVQPATVAGRLHRDLATRAGLNRAAVIAVAGHDTLSAAAAVPDAGEDCVFVSCGTWLIPGVVRQKPLITADALSKGFANELGVGSVLLCRGMMGLYLFENLRRSQAKGGMRRSYSQMAREAASAKPFAAALDLNAPLFFVSNDPARSVGEFLRKTGQKGVRGHATVARLLLEGVAWNIRQAAEDLPILTGRALKRVCLTGGGSRNALLCQMTADATGLEVIAGPAEAAVTGNLGLQAVATGRLRSPDDIRNMARCSFKLRTYRPCETDAWNRYGERWRSVAGTA